MRALLFLSFMSVISLYAAGGGAVHNPPQTVASVELPRYLGKWYEVARVPNSFQDNKKKDFGECYNTIAQYSQRPSGKLDVQNTCYRYNASNEEMIDISNAKAEVVEGSNNSKLKVNFTGIAVLDWIGIGDGDYWILALGKINPKGYYSWAFVGSPKRDFGWILSRTPKLNSQDLISIDKAISSKGYSKDQFKIMLTK